MLYASIARRKEVFLILSLEYEGDLSIFYHVSLMLDLLLLFLIVA
jgi:hypothetical protein